MQTDADILIVEDSATQALRLQFYLQERGYVVATVPDGVQALHYLAGQRPRLVVCDVLMPHMDGYELCRRIRADEALRQVPVLMWTQLDTPEDAATGLAAGAVAVVQKPLGDEALHQAVQRLLGSTDTEAGAAADGYVLIVEDSQTQAIQLEETLRDRGYQTRTAVNGREALEAIRQRQPTLVVSDVRMPVMDGLQLCRALKQDPELCRIPVILLTSLSAPTDVLAALEVGADFHIPKPYQGDYLAARIAEVLARSGEGGPVVGATAEETVTFGGTTYPVTTSREQALRLLLSTYEVASQQNRDLLRMRAELQALNETLEQRVQERTAALTAEIAERVRAEQGRAALESQLLQAQKLESVGRQPSPNAGGPSQLQRSDFRVRGGPCRLGVRPDLPPSWGL